MDWRVATLSGHKKAVNCLLPLSETLLASGSDDCTARIWDLRSQTSTKCFLRCLSQPVTALMSLARDPPPSSSASPHLFACVSGNSVFSFDLRSSNILESTPTEVTSFPVEEISAVKLHPHKSHYVVGDEEGALWLYSRETKGMREVGVSSTKKKKETALGHSNIISSIDFRPNSKYDMVSAGYDSRVCFWDTSRASRPLKSVDLNLIRGEEGSSFLSPSFVLDVCYACEGRLVACALANGQVVFLHSKTGEEVFTLEAAHADMASLLLAYRKTSLLSAGTDKLIKSWTLEWDGKSSARRVASTKTRETSSPVFEAVCDWSIAHSLKINAISFIDAAGEEKVSRSVDSSDGSSCSGSSLFVADTSSNITIYSR